MSEESTAVTTAATKPANVYVPKDNTLGIVAFVFGAISIVIFAPLFVPLSVLFALIALFKRQFLFSFLAIVCSAIGFVTSPVLLAITAGILANAGVI